MPFAIPSLRIPGFCGALAVLFACALVSCTGFDRTVAGAVERTVPSRVPRPHVSTERQGDSFVSTWEFEDEGTILEYATWVTRRLEPQFVRRPTAGGTMLFQRQLEGDVQTIEIDAHLQGGKIAVQVAFRAMAF